jgi:hypothetical protein
MQPWSQSVFSSSLSPALSATPSIPQVVFASVYGALVMNTGSATQPEIANLATTRKEQAAAKTAHPAGKATPAKKAPARAPAKKAAPVPAGSKLRWTLDGERNAKGAVAQHAETSEAPTRSSLAARSGRPASKTTGCRKHTAELPMRLPPQRV